MKDTTTHVESSSREDPRESQRAQGGSGVREGGLAWEGGSALRGPRAARDGPRAARDGPRAARDGPRAARDGPRAALDGPRAARDIKEILRWLYLPYACLVFAPFLGLTTVGWGGLAAIISRFSPRLAFHCGTIWSFCLCRANLTRVRLKGREHLQRGQSYIIMSNHQSHFDVLAFYGHFGRQFRWVIKKELRRVPGLGWYCTAGGHIFVDRSSREAAIESLHAARPLLDGGISVMIFPEGTRSPDGHLQPFKKGGFMMALDLGLPILPVSISGSRHVLPGKSLRPLPGSIEIQIHEPIDVTRYGLEGRDRLMEDVRRAIQQGLPA